MNSPCLVLDWDEEEVGSDGDLPFAAEKRGFVSFLSIQDIQSVKMNLEDGGPPPVDPETFFKATLHYWKMDSYIPE